MAHTKSAEKRNRQNERDRQRNIAVKARMKTFIKKAMTALETKDQESIKVSVPEALSEIDRAACKGVIHPNSAARKKSMIQRRIAAASQATA